MNAFPGPVTPGPTQLLTRARFLLQFVDQSIQMVLSQVTGGTVRLSETTIRSWTALLTAARDALNQIVAPAIFPPPSWLTLIQAATRSIDNALQLLNSIPIAAVLIFPPVPGSATVSVQLLQQVEANVRFAEQAIEAAERELARG